ncbi:nnrU family protein [Asticcacaulis biprosthecium C19]|uniref:NnrU family protein n=1 Tax=Asticcacaulis biprosthecium C19 TaxID=715226 RepID=F4QPT0_9CAUL|nr:NnrU family protein [Asticcacaulis biprosthecium]EGF90217.1 nnrU family protein [Asticcacaulis biprosthecium C19]
MWTLALACAFFLCIHLMISGTHLKEQIIGRIGGTAYYVIFAILSLVGLIGMCVAFAIAQDDKLNFVFWTAPLPLRIIALVVNFLAFFLLILGLTTPSPTNLLALWRLPDKSVYGVIRISRHPVLAGISLWAVTHIISSANLASWLFFGSLLGVCALGAANIDRKRLALMGDTYASILRRTSIIPFVAIIEGRTAFAPEELGIARMFLAASMFSMFAVLHEMLFIVRAL